MDLWHIVLHEYLGAIGLESHHILDLALDAVSQDYLLVLFPLKHQSLERTLQELEKQHLGSLLGPDINLDAVVEVALEEADFSLQVGEVEKPGLLVEIVEPALDVLRVLVVDKGEYFVDVPGCEDLSDVFF